MGQLDGKVVIVTGAAQGMGRRHAEACAAQGASVVATDLQVDRGRDVVAPLGDAATFVEHDVTDPAAWQRVVDTALERYGALHGLVNNAAVYFGPVPIEDEPWERFELTIKVNVFGTWWGVRTCAPHLRASGGGSIVNVSSTAGLQGHPGFTSYGTSKWAVRGMTKSAAQDLGPGGIRVNSVHPGGIEGTGMYPVPQTDEEREARWGRIPLRRAGKVDEVSALVVFLLSDASSYVTGMEHVVDGGASTV